MQCDGQVGAQRAHIDQGVARYPVRAGRPAPTDEHRPGTRLLQGEGGAGVVHQVLDERLNRLRRRHLDRSFVIGTRAPRVAAWADSSLPDARTTWSATISPDCETTRTHCAEGSSPSTLTRGRISAPAC